VNEFLICKAQAGRSDRYLEDLRFRLERFTQGRRLVPTGDCTFRDVEEWLARENSWNAKSKIQAVGVLQTFFRWGIRRRYNSTDPTAPLELERAAQGPPRIHTPAEVARVLGLALVHDPGVARNLALRYFSGLRTAEALRLSPADIGATRIEVTAAKSKTRSRRLVPIRENLRAWLAATPDELLESNWRHTEFIRHSGIEWPQNVTRHSFVSHAMAADQNAARVALESGHSETMLFTIYREVVTPEQARAYFSIYPPGHKEAPPGP